MCWWHGQSLRDSFQRPNSQSVAGASSGPPTSVTTLSLCHLTPRCRSVISLSPCHLTPQLNLTFVCQTEPAIAALRAQRLVADSTALTRAGSFREICGGWRRGWSHLPLRCELLQLCHCCFQCIDLPLSSLLSTDITASLSASTNVALSRAACCCASACSSALALGGAELLGVAAVGQRVSATISPNDWAYRSSAGTVNHIRRHPRAL